MSHLARRDRVAAHFRRYPNRWVHYEKLMELGGRLAWRTRVSDCRKELDMAIENKIDRDKKGVADSYYRYVPRKSEQLANFAEGA